MHASNGSNVEIGKISMECKCLVSVLLSDIPSRRESVSISSEDRVFDRVGSNCICLIKEGYVKYIRDGRTLYMYGKDDLIGLETICRSKYSEYVADGEAIIDEYAIESLFGSIRENPLKLEVWNRFLANQFNVQGLMITSLMKAEIDVKPIIREYAPGEVILLEGSEGTDVYTMFSGTAEVLVKGTKVGYVRTDEIFGAIAALTGIPRTATVRASKPCVVVAANKTNFMHLLSSRPDTILKLIEDMTRVIVSTNEQIIELKKLIGKRTDKGASEEQYPELKWDYPV